LKRKRRKKRQPKKVTGLSWLQKLAIEGAIEYAIGEAEAQESIVENQELLIAPGFKKLLALIRKKTKHMKPPRRRRKRKVKS
jgi:uncharacterized protein involved in propanediol utilization